MQLQDRTVTATRRRIMGELLGHFKAKFLPGLALIAPVGVTVFILHALLQWADALMAPVVQRWLGVEVFGLGLLATVAMIYLAGLVATNVFGRRLVRAFEGLLLRLPMINMIHGSTKQVLEVLSQSQNAHRARIVLVEYPRQGIKSLAFVTGRMPDPRTGEMLLTLFVPSSPNPITGYTMFVQSDAVEDTRLTFEEAIQLLASGGIVMPSGQRSRAEGVPLERGGPVLSPEVPPAAGAQLVGSKPMGGS